MKNHLAITAIGEDHTTLLSELTLAIKDSGCSIQDSRMTLLGGQFAMLMMVRGNWNSVVKLENALPGLQDRLGLSLVAKRTEPRAPAANWLPYIIEIVTVEQPGVIYRLAEFFASRHIHIEDLYTGCYPTPHSSTPLFSLNMTVNVPSDVHIASLREQFMDFCDELNLDGVIEPLKR